MVDLHELLHGELSRNEEGFYSFSTEAGDGVSVTFPFSFVGEGKAYLRDSDIHVFLRDSDPESENYNELTEILDDLEFPTENTVTLTTVIGTPVDLTNNIFIRRIMPKDTTYANTETDAIFRKQVLNNSFLQSLYVVHEALDGFLGTDNLTVQVADLYNRMTRTLKVNLDDPVGDEGLIIPTDREGKYITFDSLGNILLVSEVSAEAIPIEEEIVTILNGETTVAFLNNTVEDGAIYIRDGSDRGRLFVDLDYTISGEKVIELVTPAVGTTQLLCVNDERVSGTGKVFVHNLSSLALALNSTVLRAGDSVNIPSGGDGEGMWDVLSLGTTPNVDLPNGDDILASTSVPSLVVVERKNWGSRIDTDIVALLLNPVKRINHIYQVKDFISGSLDGKGGEWLFEPDTPKSDHDGSHTISPTVPWDGAMGQTHQDFIDGVGETDVAGAGCLVRQFKGEGVSNLQPLFVEQFLSGFQGRGQLDSEPNNLVTEQNLIGNFTKGAIAVNVADTPDFVDGGHITILHDNGRYWSYLIINNTLGALTIAPTLKYDASGTPCERTWYNKAHAGKFYMRQLAQRVALDSEVALSLPQGRVLFSQYDTSPNDITDVITPIGGAGVSYFDASNLGSSGGVDSVPRFNIGRTAFVTCNSVGDGARTFEAQVSQDTSQLLKLILSTSVSNMGLEISIWSNNPESVGSFIASVELPPLEKLRTPIEYIFPFQLTGDARSVYVEIVTTEQTIAGAIILDQIEIYPTKTSNASIFDSRKKQTIVVFGDSWVAGDLGSTPEREPIPYQLQASLPYAKVINEGVGGNTAGHLLARFDNDVAPHEPDYVLINTGTNDAYNPSSGTFFPNAVDNFVRQINQLISKCQSIGAKPILIGVPALAESDGAFSSYELNDRARQYSQYFYKRIGKLINSSSVGTVAQAGGVPVGATVSRVDTGSGEVVKFADGTIICTREIAMDMTVTNGIAVNFPEAFLSGTIPACSFSIQTLLSGNTTTAMKDAFMRCTGNLQWVMYFPTAGTETDTFNLMAVGRWY